MKSIISLLSILITANFVQAQQQMSLREISSNIRFDKLIDEFNNGKDKIKYADIQGIPYYYAKFIDANVDKTSGTIPIRYNIFLDTIEVMDKQTVYEIPKDEPTPAFTFTTTKEKLVFVNTNDIYAGHFFELTAGKYRILKKVQTKYIAAIPSTNPLIAGTSAQFILDKPLYFIQSEDGFTKIPKNAKELATAMPNKGQEILDFVNKNKIKLNREEDLIKLGTFLNQ